MLTALISHNWGTKRNAEFLKIGQGAYTISEFDLIPINCTIKKYLRDKPYPNHYLAEFRDLMASVSYYSHSWEYKNKWYLNHWHHYEHKYAVTNYVYLLSNYEELENA